MERVLQEGVNDALSVDALDKRAGRVCDKVGAELPQSDDRRAMMSA
jgi:hypothetical protein